MAGEEGYTPIEDIAGIVEDLRSSFDANVARGLDHRAAQLERLEALITENTAALAEAVQADLGRHPTFSKRILGGCVASTKLAREKMEEWGAPVPTTDTCAVRYTPRGVALIVGTWNFPNPLVWKPLASAIAAGNTVLLKLNEVCEHTSALMAALVSKYLDSRCVRIVLGGIPVATEVLRQRFDVIFYTGNTTVGKVVMRAAAEHLTPCILELGGKNPVIVADDANIPVAARKIVNGRFLNTGQFCVAPDYVLVSKASKDALAAAMVVAVKEFFTEDPKSCPSYGRIASERHATRLSALLEGHGGEVLVGGDFDIAERYVAPTLILDPTVDSPVMAAEIFGPILPIVEVDDVDAALKMVCARPRSLALYVFSSNQATIDRVIDSTYSGGACANDVIIHMLNEDLPFGGCGDSGMGSYHGVWGFKAFSHEKGVMVVDARDDGGARYPPYN